MARGPTLKPPPWEGDSVLVWQPLTAAESQSGHLRHLKVKCFHGKFEDPSSSLDLIYGRLLTQEQWQILKPRVQFFLFKNTGLVLKCHQMSPQKSVLELTKHDLKKLPGWRIKALHRADSGHGVQICSISIGNAKSGELTLLTRLESIKSKTIFKLE